MRNLYTESFIISNVSAFPNYSTNRCTSFNGGHRHTYQNSSSCCCCCCCSCNCVSSIPIRTVYSSRLVPVNPIPFYGFSQSALIKKGPSRMRMIVGSGDYYRNSSYVRDLGFDWIRCQDVKLKKKGIGFGGYGSVVEQRCVLRKLGAACDDAEAIISLLNEESDDDIDDGRIKKVISKKGNFRENVVDKRSKSRKEKVITEVKQELKSRRTDKYRASDNHTVKMQCSSRVRDNRASETTDLRKKYDHLRERIGFVDGKSTTYKRRDSDSEEYVGSESGRRDHVRQSMQSESRVSNSRKDTSLERQYNSGVGESMTEVYNSSDMRRSGHRVKDNRASNSYEHLTGSSGFVDEKSSRYLSKASGREEHVISAGETSDSTYKYKYITDSSGYLSRRNDKEERVFSAGGFCSSCGKVTSESEARTTDEQRSHVYAETKVVSSQKASSSSKADKAHEQRKQEQFVASGQVNLMKSENYSERADVAERYEENTSISRLRSELSETRLTSTVGQQSELVVDEKSHQENLVATSKTELVKGNQEYTELVDSDGSSVNLLEEKVVSVSSQTAKEELFQTGQKQSLKAQSGSSHVYIDGAMAEETSSASEDMLWHSQSYWTERVKQTHEHVKDTIKQTELRYEVEAPLKEPSFVTSTSQYRIEEIGEDQDKRNTPPVPSPRLDQPPQSIKVTHEHTSQQTTEQVQFESQVSNSYKDTSLKLPYNFGVGESVTTVDTSDSSDKYERLTGVISFVDEKSSTYLSKASGSEELVIAVGETSDSTYKYNHTTDSSGLNKVSDSLVSSSLTAIEAHEQHNQEHFVASSQVNLMKSEDYTDRADVAEGYVENTNISRLRSELSETRLTSTVEEQFELVVGEKSHQERPVASSQTEFMRENLEFAQLVDSGDNNVNVLKENVVSVSSQSGKEELFQTGKKQPLSNQSGISQVDFDGTMIEGSSSASQSYLTERVKETHERVKETITQIELRYEVQIPVKEPSFVTSTSQVRIEEMNEVEYARKTASVTSPRLDQPSESVEVKQEHTSQSGIVKRSGKALWNVLTYGVLNTGDNISGEIKIELNDDKMSSQATVSTDGLHSDSVYELLESGKEATGIMDKSKDDKEMIIASSQTELVRDNQESTQLIDFVDSNVNILVSDSSQTAEEELLQTGPKKSFKAQSGTMIEGSASASEETLRYEQIYLSGRVKETHEHDPEHVKETINKTEIGYEVQTPLEEPSFVRTGSRLPFGTSSSRVRIEEIVEDQDKTNIPSVPSLRLGPLHQSEEVTHEHKSQSGVAKRSGRALWNALAYGVLNTDSNVFELNADKISSQATISTDHLQPGSIYELQESGSIVDKTKDDNDMNVASENAAELKRGALVRSNQVMKDRFDEWEEAYRLKSELRETDETFMREALEEAKKAADMWEVPVGAVLVQDGKIIARGHNLVEESRDSTAHAEMVCIRSASTALKSWRLLDTTLYVTLEPCAMCAGAILQSRIGTLVYGAPNKLLGADGSWVRLFPTSANEEEGSTKTEGPVHPFHPNMKIRRGILEEECGELMQRSFKLRRKDKGKKTEQKSDKKLHINPSKLLNKMHHKFHFLFHL